MDRQPAGKGRKKKKKRHEQTARRKGTGKKILKTIIKKI
jgi:hypothetical protein